ncbi:MAG: hypothetical protein AAFY56_15055 [Pseudomonadota bacterium]
MDLFKRFSDYDVFAYLPQGFLALAAVDYLFATNFVLNGGWDVPKGFLIMFGAYIIGHLIASPSSKIIEKWVVRGFMKQPATHLLTSKTTPWVLRVIFADYYTPLSEPLRREVLNKMGSEDPDRIPGETLFWKAYPLAKRDEHAKDRMGSFINLYGFCRNVCFVSGLTALTLFVQLGWGKWVSHIPPDNEKIAVAVILSIVSFMMFQRYLKFHRLYSVEVFTTFAKVAPTPPAHAGKQEE